MKTNRSVPTWDWDVSRCFPPLLTRTRCCRSRAPGPAGARTPGCSRHSTVSPQGKTSAGASSAIPRELPFPPCSTGSCRPLRAPPGAATAPAPPRSSQAQPAGGGCGELAPAPGQRVPDTSTPSQHPLPAPAPGEAQHQPQTARSPRASPSSGGSAEPGSTQRSPVVYFHSRFCYGRITECSPQPRSSGSACWLPRATEAAESGIEPSAAPAGALDPPPLQQFLCFFLFLW